MSFGEFIDFTDLSRSYHSRLVIHTTKDTSWRASTSLSRRVSRAGKAVNNFSMPPRSNRSFQRTLSTSSNTSSSSSSSKPRLKQNKLDFSFHSTSSSTRSSGSRPLSSTPSFGLPAAVPTTTTTHQQPPPPTQLPPVRPPPSTNDKGKQKQQGPVTLPNHPSQPDHADSLWSERLAPLSIQELAIHPKKVAQVRTWLQESFSSTPALVKHRKVLALTGPAGAGKSATVRALATDLDFDILEWHNDQPSFDANAPGPSFIERFTDFLSKAAKFPTLKFHEHEHEQKHEQEGESSSITCDAASNRHRAILLEDLPNLHHLPTKELFQTSLQYHIQQSIALTSRGFANVPVILIVTESTPREDQDRWAGDSTTTWRERLATIVDTRTALGQTIRQHPSYTEMRFNPVAPTIVLKGLKRAMELTAGRNDKAWLELLHAVAEDSNGDLRAAVNCLQFLGAKHLDIKMNGSAKKRTMTKLIRMVSGRESSLALFHALGKVLYNKREGDPGDDFGQTANKADDQGSDDDQDSQSENEGDRIPLKHRLNKAMQFIVPPAPNDETVYQLPVHMSHLYRHPSRVQPDQLWADLPVDSTIFQLYLHQNLPQFTTEIEQCETILDGFSTADALTPLHDGYRFSTLSAYYAFLISIRATLIGLPSPVRRQGQKLGKATWWDVQKKLRGILLDVEDVKASSLRIDGRIDREDVAGGRGLRRTKFNQPSDSIDEMQRSGARLGEASMQTTLLRSDAVTLVTEVLPLLAKIRPDAFDGKAADVARMRFDYAGVADTASRMLDEHDSGIVADDDHAEDDEAGGQRLKVHQRVKRNFKPEQEVGEQENLILSDDDIDDF